MNRDNIFVGLVGVSGVGKSTIAAALRDYCEFTLLQSYTTRAPRGSELPGELQFVTDREYDDLDEEGYFLEKASHGTARYALACPEGPGPYVSPINGDGIRHLRKHEGEHGLHVVPVGIIPPDMTTLMARNQATPDFSERAARDHHHGVRLPPDLINARYEMILTNRSPFECAHLIHTLVMGLCSPLQGYTVETLTTGEPS